MRPHCRHHQSAEQLLRYDLRAGSEILGGTVIAASPAGLYELFDRMGGTGMPGFVQVTLSAPEDTWLERSAWLDVFALVQDRHRLPKEITPWVLVRHRDASCDHVHGFVALRTFEGLPLSWAADPMIANETHQRLSRLLGIEEPYYFDEGAGPRLEGQVPDRRLRASAEYPRLAADLNAAFRSWPKDLTALNAALSDLGSAFQMKRDRNLREQPSFLCRSDGLDIRPGLLGREFYPRTMSRRLALSAALPRARLIVEAAILLDGMDIDGPLAVLANATRKERMIDAERQPNTDEPTHTGRGALDRDESCKKGCATPAPAPRPFDRPGRCLGGRGRAVDRAAGLDERADGSDRVPGRGTWGEDAGGSARGPRPSIRPFPPVRDAGRGRLTVIEWLAQLIKVAQEAVPGVWRRINIKRRTVRLGFRDRSEVDVTPDSVTLADCGERNGADAVRFATAYCTVSEHIMIPPHPITSDPLLRAGAIISGSSAALEAVAQERASSIDVFGLADEVEDASTVLQLFSHATGLPVDPSAVNWVVLPQDRKILSPVLVLGHAARIALREDPQKWSPELQRLLDAAPSAHCLLPSGGIRPLSVVVERVERLARARAFPASRPEDDAGHLELR